MTIEFNCHVCGKLLRTADNKAGRTAKCPGCGESLTVPATDVEDYDSGEADESDYDDYGDVPAPSSRGGSTKACPMCGEQISRRATRCEYCGENVGSGGGSRRRRSGVAREKVSGPAIGLMVAAGFNITASLLGALVNVMGMAQPGFQRGNPQMPVMVQGGIGLVFNVIALIAAVVIILGALKMKRLESYGMAMTAAIVAMIPCISSCCLVGLPLGIWALVVLNDAEVKNSFHD